MIGGDVGVLEDRRHLELACGTGTLLELLLRWRAFKRLPLPERLVGVDYAESMLGGAIQRFRKQPQFEFLLADAADMPLEADPEATFGYLLQELSARGIAFLFVRAPEGSPGDMPMLRRTFKGTYIANGNYDADSAAAAVASGKADAVSFGRPYIANPDLVARFAAKAPLNALVMEALQGGDAYGYTDDPVLADAAE